MALTQRDLEEIFYRRNWTPVHEKFSGNAAFNEAIRLSQYEIFVVLFRSNFGCRHFSKRHRCYEQSFWAAEDLPLGASLCHVVCKEDDMPEQLQRVVRKDKGKTRTFSFCKFKAEAERRLVHYDR